MRLPDAERFAICTKALAGGIRPEPEITISQWAEQHRVLVQTSSAEPGKWRNERTPYLIEIMDSLSPSSGIEQVSVMKGAQGGFTEAGNNWTGAVMHRFPGPMLYVQPTVETVKRYSQTRLAPMIAACPVLMERVADSKSRDSSNTLFLKTFPGGVLVLGGANSAVALRSMPIRFLFLDECDAYPVDVDGEGDPVELAIIRTKTFRNRKIFKISTPTLVGVSHIEKAYKQGDQRQWWVPCPNCSRLLVFHWKLADGDDLPGGFKWKWGSPGTIHYQCDHCHKPIQEHKKTWMNSNGTWIPQVPDAEPKIRSYHWPSLYSPYGWPGSSWPELAKKWEQGKNDPTKVKVFYNAELGLPYEDKASRRAEPHALMERCELFPQPLADGTLVVNNAIALLTLGADVQPNRIEWEIVGWGAGEESWSVFKGEIHGDTSTPGPWVDFERALQMRFRNEAGVGLQLFAACVDANFNTQSVTSWCGPRFNRKVWAIRGMAGRRPIWPRKPGATKYNKTPLFTIGVDAAKEAIIGRLTIEDPGPGYCHFPVGREEDYFEQLTAEVCVTLYDKTPPYNVWKKKSSGARNEALDCRVYAYAALCGLISGGFRLDAEADKIAQVVAAYAQARQHAVAAQPRGRRIRGRFAM